MIQGMRRVIPRIITGALLALALLASFAVLAMTGIVWACDDGVSPPDEYRVWDGRDGSTYFAVLGAGRLTLVKQDVTRPPDGAWSADVTGVGNVQIRAGGKSVASVTSAPRWRGWPPKAGRFHQSGPKVVFVAPPALPSQQVCAINYSGVALPLWAVAVVGALPPAAWLLSLLRTGRTREARLRAGLCVECGYDLRGSPGRCPECGTARPPETGVTTA